MRSTNFFFVMMKHVLLVALALVVSTTALQQREHATVSNVVPAQDAQLSNTLTPAEPRRKLLMAEMEDRYGVGVTDVAKGMAKMGAGKSYNLVKAHLMEQDIKEQESCFNPDDKDSCPLHPDGHLLDKDCKTCSDCHQRTGLRFDRTGKEWLVDKSLEKSIACAWCSEGGLKRRNKETHEEYGEPMKCMPVPRTQLGGRRCKMRGLTVKYWFEPGGDEDADSSTYCPAEPSEQNQKFKSTPAFKSAPTSEEDINDEALDVNRREDHPWASKDPSSDSLQKRKSNV